MLRPVVKWAGGKRQILPEIVKRLPINWDVYYEPFIGGAALLIELNNSKKINKAIISDINLELINLYNVIKKSPEDLLQELQSGKYQNDQEIFYQFRDHFNEIKAKDEFDIERASIFIYLNRHCFNGLWRVNKKNNYNVPFGRYKNPKLADNKMIHGLSQLFQKVNIRNEDFEVVVADAKEGDFVYFDPPYMPLSDTAHFTNYTSNGFSYDDQVRLAETYKRLAEKGVSVMLSNSDAPAIHELYGDFNISVIRANRSINSDASKRTGVTEVIVTNYPVKTDEIHTLL
ncbi:DNA adenine methylase [Methanogenium organophilum]|uniref:site-specific DNA-methyltransferase (adenine-specific) n=1 Tax=Methanogenium organophilum TaxID=2199 RepID=A0A9X9S3Q7_METOG|nr:DNA adenine methylase [Methanogenium organophilum]WAI01354.1 DNA adenine methylase [Methanogenium organophilum]